MENQFQQNALPNQPLTQTSVSQSTNQVRLMFLLVLGTAVVAGLVFTYVEISKKQTTNQQSSSEQQRNTLTQTVIEPTTLPTVPSPINTIQGVKFSGIITRFNNGCWADGICSIEVDNKSIITEIGGLRPSNSKPEIRGGLIGINFNQDTDNHIGKSVEIYAEQTGAENFTIYGNESYYVKLLD